ncbi:MAG: porin family protein [Ectothiorhodospiraceae bacterium]|nr:porin family protein [Ectothiorhodospiraceae bacterium]
MKTNTVIATLCGALALSAAAPVFSANDITISRPHSMSSNMASNLYFGVQLGNANYDTLNDSSPAFALFGGYHLNEVLALDVAYTSFGEAEDDSNKLEATAFSLGILGKLPIKTDLTLYGKVGLAKWDADLTIPTFGSGTDSGTDVYFGAGIDYDISGSSAVRFGIDFYTFDGDDVDEDIASVSVGFVFKL